MTGNIQAGVKASREYEGIVRVYRIEPINVYTTPGCRHATTAIAQARAWVERNLADRVGEILVEYATAEAGSEIIATVTVHAPVMKGEFKSHQIAKEWLCRQTGWDHTEVEIIAKNSKRDHEIRAFGVKRQT